MLNFFKHTQYSFFVLILIVLLTLIPSGEVPSSQGVKIDKPVHFILFSFFVFITIIGLIKQYTFTYLHQKAEIIALLVAFFLAFATELLQASMKQGRAFEWMDIVADLSGAFVGYLIFLLFQGKDQLKIE